MQKHLWRKQPGPPVVLAPMAGVTDRAFRTVCRHWGADMAYSEMISAKGLRFQSKRTFAIGDVRGEPQSGVQLFGSDPKDIADAICTLQELQQEHVACFDINMGCPAPKIVNNGEGSALMKDPALAAAMVRAAKEVSKVPVTVKFRKGFDAKQGDAVSFAKTMEDAGADGITVHGRLREQYYAGKADWDCIAEVKRQVCIPVLANGDVFTPEDAAAILQHTGADGIMVGRGAMGDPFLFTQIRQFLETGAYMQPTPEQKAEALLWQAELCIAEKGEYKAMQEFRKHMAWYMKGMRGAAVWRQQALSLSNMAQLQALTEQFFLQKHEEMI